MRGVSNRARRWCALLLLLPLTQACSVRVIDYTAMTSKNIDVSGLKPVGRYSGEDCRWNVLGIPIGIPTWKEGVDEALEKGRGDVLLDAVFTNKWWMFFIGQSCVEVTGTVARSPSYPG